MVSTEIAEKIAKHYELVKSQAIDIHQYSGDLAEVVFDLITAETFVAGVASKLIEHDSITHEEKTILCKGSVISDGWYSSGSRAVEKITKDQIIFEYAKQVEELRLLCVKGFGLN